MGGNKYSRRPASLAADNWIRDRYDTAQVDRSGYLDRASRTSRSEESERGAQIDHVPRWVCNIANDAETALGLIESLQWTSCFPDLCE